MSQQPTVGDGILNGAASPNSRPQDCPRCRGLMVKITLEDVGGSTTRDTFFGWQCLLCGEIIDPGIVANRKGHQEPTRNRSRPRYGAWLGGTAAAQGTPN
jgi:hypothetical protein